jgi:hypothetical protein
MKALTICQPYAQLIVRGEKRIENRTWPTTHRGSLYIHAGKSRSWWDDELDGKRYPNAPFGAVVAIAKLVNCVSIEAIHSGKYDDLYPWAREHQHANGPWCWILDNVTPIGPWPWRGAQGLFDIDSEELGRVANRELGITASS